MNTNAAPSKTIIASAPKEANFSGLESVIEAIVQVAAFEADKMKNNEPFDMSTISMRKARLLLDFNVASKDIDVRELPERTKVQLKNMQVALRRSVRQYQFHSNAVREIASLVIEADKARTSDGTYGNCPKN